MSLNPDNLKWGSAYRERCEREDEEDRLASVAARYDIEGQAKALNAPERVGLAVTLLMSLVDDGVLKGWKIEYPERGDA